MYVQNVLKSVVSAPLKLLQGAKNLFTGNTYQRLQQKSAALADGADGDGQRCLETTIFSDQEEIEALAKGIRDQNCTCRAWGTCTKGVCPCKKLCPWSLELLKRGDIKELKDYSKPENSLAFRNTPEAFKNHRMQFGYCAGHAVVTQAFNRLAFFDENAPKKSSSYYKKVIDKIANNKAVDIPGYKNLQEFSSDPEMQEYIADVVAKKWAEDNSQFSKFTDLGVFFGQRANGHEVFAKIKSRLDNFQQPTLTLSSSYYRNNPHLIMISHYKRDEQGRLILCARENNFPPQENHDCERFFRVNERGKIEANYHGQYEVKYANISSTENPNTVEQINSLQKYCRKKKGCSLLRAL